MAREGGTPPSREREEPPLIRPDTFWELIEKLLLHKTRDEQSRRRHNAALSALCRGHALPRVPREQKQKTDRPNNLSSVTTRHRDTLFIPNATRATLKTTLPSDVEDLQSNKCLRAPRSQSVNDEENPATAKEAKSECTLNDLDIVYVKEASVPASERLWRYAIKNRKRSEARDRDVTDSTNTPQEIPCIRSNEAIYLGLRKRLEDSLREKKINEKREKENKESEIKRRHSCDHIQKIRSDMQVYAGKKGVTKVKRTPSFQNQPATSNTDSILRKALKSTRSVPTMQENAARIKTMAANGLVESGIRKWPSRDQLFSPWGTEDPWSDLTKVISVKSKERFDSKKALYNSVIKRRLNCGNQLDSLNKEIISKRNSPRTVLSKETTRKYAELKNEYLNLCYQESTLRHQISLLHAEIYMMQNKGFHRTPASIKTITFDAQTTPLHRNHSVPDHVTEGGSVQMFPSLKAPRPLIQSQQKLNAEKQFERPERVKRLAARAERKASGVAEDSSRSCFPAVDGGPAPHGVCSIYSITPQIVTQQREPFTLNEYKTEKLIHRLPRMTFDPDTPFSAFNKM